MGRPASGKTEGLPTVNCLCTGVMAAGGGRRANRPHVADSPHISLLLGSSNRLNSVSATIMPTGDRPPHTWNPEQRPRMGKCVRALGGEEWGNPAVGAPCTPLAISRQEDLRALPPETGSGPLWVCSTRGQSTTTCALFARPAG